MSEVDPSAATVLGIEEGTVLLGQYALERRLGAGGMGEVWLAQDQHLKRAVAVKVLPAVLATSARAAEALRSEAARAIELSHRSIARVYHYGLHDDLPVLVMEYVEGESLAEHLDAHRDLTPARVVELLEPLVEALDYAHEQKVVHRDIKPANIMLRTDGSPVLMDFGLAAEARDQGSRHGKTGEMEISGTLAYMSPEQIKGKRPRKAMDLYSLAATAYEMLGGNPPFFRGDTAAIYQQIIHEPVEPLERWGDPVDRVLVQALAKDPDDRYPSAGAFLAALGEAISGTGPSARSAAAETVVNAAVPVDPKGGATTVLDAPLAAPAKRAWVGPLVGVVGLALIALLVAGPGDPDPAPTPTSAPLVSPVPVAPVTVAPPARPAEAVGMVRFEVGGRVTPRGAGILTEVDGQALMVMPLLLFDPAGGPAPARELAAVRAAMPRVSMLVGSQVYRPESVLPLEGIERVTGVQADAFDAVAFRVSGVPAGLSFVQAAPVDGAELSVVVQDGSVYRARHQAQDGFPARTYVFEGAPPPMGSAGSPVLDARNRVVGLHVANFSHGGANHGICTRGERILHEVRRVQRDGGAAPAAPRAFPMAHIGRFEYEHEETRGSGTGVVIDLDGASVVLTAHHLFRPANGVQRVIDQLGGLPILSKSVLHRGDQHDRLPGYVRFPEATTVSGVHEDPLDVAGFYLGPSKGGLRLVEDEPPDGAPVHVVMHDGTAYPARHRLADGWPARTYVFEGAVPPPGSSGAPVLDAEDRVVGLHLANFEHQGQQHGMCTRGENILFHLRPALSATLKSGRSGPAPASK